MNASVFTNLAKECRYICICGLTHIAWCQSRWFGSCLITSVFLLNWSIWIPRGRSVFFFFKSWIPDRCFSDLSESSVAKSWFSPFIVCTETRSMLSRQLDFSLWSFRCDSLHWLVDFYIWLSWSYSYGPTQNILYELWRKRWFGPPLYTTRSNDYCINYISQDKVSMIISLQHPWIKNMTF